jgi:hypothetical protein
MNRSVIHAMYAFSGSPSSGETSAMSRSRSGVAMRTLPPGFQHPETLAQHEAALLVANMLDEVLAEHVIEGGTAEGKGFGDIEVEDIAAAGPQVGIQPARHSVLGRSDVQPGCRACCQILPDEP